MAGSYKEDCIGGRLHEESAYIGFNSATWGGRGDCAGPGDIVAVKSQQHRPDVEPDINTTELDTIHNT